ncbi:bi-domain-containing oxidoreductase [Dyadobacter luticola]|uniref:Zinc-binding dehydrogenase n=1 Tax=Dyadobacter luticola TaxID=1979387 RepID=A0A5R9KV92_9BACT|nr:bi-domain-containing oxidoreductase [Dyadobacter luticola]TLV00154.1 zinc-binding dehydrogenase [Dyadobacter luticola]
MKQLAQHLRTGATILQEVPTPIVKKGCVLIRTHKTLVSPGTEKMLLDFSRANLLSKVWHNADRTREVLRKIKTEGLLPTMRAVSNKLDELLPLGYSNVGEVVAVGEGVLDFKCGDRVVSNGPHAEIVCVPVNLVCKIPANVPDEEAVFTVLGAVALQGIRLLEPALGETVVVIGLGLIGWLTAALLKANGCQVIGVEPENERLKLAADLGIITVNPQTQSVENHIRNVTDGIGADGVIIAASSKSDKIISQAANIARKRGKIVLTGNVGLKLNRAEFYKKELTFQVSCSYGPGRYDPGYEQEAIDYPVSFVRWTENRNFQAVLEMLSRGLLNVKPLLSTPVPLDDFTKIYAGDAMKKNIAWTIDYAKVAEVKKIERVQSALFPPTEIVSGVIGAGNYARMTLLPALKKSNVKYLGCAGGLNAVELAPKYKIPIATADYHEILADSEVSLVIIATRHNLHAKMAAEALAAGKHVFVEKPLAVNVAELEEVIAVWEKSEASLTVGFNRRFSPYATKMKSLLDGGAPMNVVITVNAGALPEHAWQNNPAIGGGRIIGEACHFIDLVSFLTGSPITAVCTNAMSGSTTCENANISMRCADGSTGVVNYFSNGHRSYPKERVEVYSQGRTLILDDFSKLTGYGFKGFSRYRAGKKKGHQEQFEQLFAAIKSGKTLISFDEIVNTSRATIAAVESIRNTKWIDVP